MNRQEFEQKTFAFCENILKKPDITVMNIPEGYMVIDGGKKVFDITIVGLFGVLNVNGNNHYLAPDALSKIYNMCQERFMNQNEESLVKTQRTILYTQAQHNTLKYLKQFVTANQKH